MKKTMQVIKNPRLDRIFSEAYRNTINLVALREQDRHNYDYYKEFATLFEKELYNRDLSADERSEFMEAFHREVKTIQEKIDTRKSKRKKMFFIVAGSAFALLLTGLSLFIAINRPFMSEAVVIEKLEHYQTKTEEGFGSYSKKFYQLLNQQERKLPDTAAYEYRENMYETLDGHFDENIAKLEAGEMRFYDDAKQWAARFPDSGERVDRKEMAENAMRKGIGTAVDETLDTVKKGARNFFQKTADFVKDVFTKDK